MPAPIVSNPGKIVAVHIPETYLYDIPTEPGQEIQLYDAHTVSSIVSINADEPAKNDELRFNTMGQRVSDSYHGIVVTRDGKYLNR